MKTFDLKTGKAKGDIALPGATFANDIAVSARDALVRSAFRQRFATFQSAATGSSTRIARALLLDTPLSIDRGEVTDKGSINQRAVLDHRRSTVETLYLTTPDADVITP